MKVLGLTGGIGSGKTTVAELFRKLGAQVIDADRIAHHLLEDHPEIIPQLIKKFGNEILNPQSQKINRQQLGVLVFSDSQKLKELEAISHPFIRKEIQKQIDQARLESFPLVLVDAALLVETGFYKAYDGLIVVKSDTEQQIERIQKRSGLSREEVLKRIAVQLPLEEKLKVADWVIDNSGDLEETKKKVKVLYQKLI